MGHDLVGKGPQDAGHHDLFLDRQVAAVAVGHLLEPGADLSDVVLGAGAGLDPVEEGGDLARALLAGRALATGLDVQES